MKNLIKLLLVIAVAVLAAMALEGRTGYASFVIDSKRYSVNLVVAILGLALFFFVGYVIVRIISRLLNAPTSMKQWSQRRRMRRELGLLERGWLGWLEGRSEIAEKDFEKLYGHSESVQRRVLASLAAAKAAHQKGDDLKRDEMLALSLDKAISYPELYDAALVVRAEILLDQGVNDEAILILEKLDKAQPRQVHIRKLLLRAYRQAGRLRDVIKQARFLQKRKALDPLSAEHLILDAAQTLIASPSEMLWESVYQELSSQEQLMAPIAIAAARRYVERNDYKQAFKMLEKSYEATGEAAILAEYVSYEKQGVGAHRLGRIQQWLEADADNADLLRAAGHLCLVQQLWGQAERYLTQSLAIEEHPVTHALLGALYDRLSRPEAALSHWRTGSYAVIDLPKSGVLPSADTKNDPSGPPDIKNLDGPDDRFIDSRTELPKAKPVQTKSNDNVVASSDYESTSKTN